MPTSKLGLDQVIERIYASLSHMSGACRCCSAVRLELKRLRSDSRKQEAAILAQKEKPGA